MKEPGLYTIPRGRPFLDDLAAGLGAIAGTAPEDLAGVTILLPTRRACLALREAFLRRSGGGALLLPKMTPVGDIDEDELALSGHLDLMEGGLDVAPALSGLRRQLLLTRLVLAFPGNAMSSDQASRLARELARLLDQVHTERLSFDDLAGLVPGELSEHWQITLDFLKILSEQWPAVLAEEGALDAAERRNLLLEAQAGAWQKNPPPGPIVAAGTTGSIPATADLLHVIAHLARGYVVLPGLDREMDADSWRALAPTHPQYAMARLLDRLQADRQDVGTWEAGAGPANAARGRLAAEALRPAETTHLWEAAAGAEAGALDGVVRIDCPTPREEAATVALMMRQALETEAKRAALITPDRALARRVAVELKRWDIDIDDSAGTPLAGTAPGGFINLSAQCIAAEAAPVPLLALFKHPLAAGGMEPARFRALTRRLERVALRGPRPAAGFEGLGQALEEAEKEGERDFAPLGDWLQGHREMSAGFRAALERDSAPLAELLAAHVAYAEALAADDAGDGAHRLWAGDAGEACAGFVCELAEAAEGWGEIAGADYPALLQSLMDARVVRRRFGGHPRLAIWGLLEARLQHADLLILGGLNEGTWPPEAKAGPWMSRPMQEDFGLPLPERRIGLAAHDFVQAFSNKEVALTRSTRVEGAPALPSRWLLRLEALTGGLPKGDRYLAWAEELDRGKEKIIIQPPAPAPPVAARPRKLSVTRIETWVRDPYALYADKILGLRPLDPIDADPGAAERGSYVHKALEAFIKAHPGPLPDAAEQRLIDIAHGVFGASLAWPGVRAFWWPRFKRIAGWFVDYQRRRQSAGISVAAAEVKGTIQLDGPAGPFQLSARADRIDRTEDGGLAIVDYKTGKPPSWKQVGSGFSPQLPLEAAIAEKGGFDGVAAAQAVSLVYLWLKGGEEAGKEIAESKDAARLAEEALAGLSRLIAQYDDPKIPYLSQPRPMFLNKYADYDHLARRQEWSAGGGEEE